MLRPLVRRFNRCASLSALKASVLPLRLVTSMAATTNGGHKNSENRWELLEGARRRFRGQRIHFQSGDPDMKTLGHLADHQIHAELVHVETLGQAV
mmetsp:Transcript_25998/g.66937  ORF Transcript_25998/g.66937 Transcript_25998/m.66937 type:complete len:96 (+) Transcript_25998:105-392(+)